MIRLFIFLWIVGIVLGIAAQYEPPHVRLNVVDAPKTSLLDQEENATRISDKPVRFGQGADYKIVRMQLLNAGYTPFHAADADECDASDLRCKDRPEMESCSGVKDANCNFLWAKNGRIIEINTVGENPVFKKLWIRTPMQ
jgi:hypothetical protein